MTSTLFSVSLVLVALAIALCLATGPNCMVPTSSPQFAVLCRLTNGTNAILPAFQNLTADQVCDGDCRCVMGAQGGGKCGTSPVDNQIYCRCDYSKPATSPLSLPCNVSSFLNLGKAACTLPLGLGGLINNTICVADCICSHGFATNQIHQCTSNNGVDGNTATYCVCNGAKNE